MLTVIAAGFIIPLLVALRNRNTAAQEASPIKGLAQATPENIITTSPAPTTAPPIVSYENLKNHRIPDLGSAISVINVNRTGDAGTVKVAVDIKHSEPLDLEITLYCPSGDSRVLREKENGSTQPNIKTEYCADMSGCDSAGNWILEVADTHREDSGTLKSWTLSFLPSCSE